MIIIKKTVGPVSIRYQAFSRPSRNPRTDYSVHSSIVLILLIRFPQSYNYKPPRASPRRHNITMSSFFNRPLMALHWSYCSKCRQSRVSQKYQSCKHSYYDTKPIPHLKASLQNIYQLYRTNNILFHKRFIRGKDDRWHPDISGAPSRISHHNVTVKILKYNRFT